MPEKCVGLCVISIDHNDLPHLKAWGSWITTTKAFAEAPEFDYVAQVLDWLQKTAFYQANSSDIEILPRREVGFPAYTGTMTE
jgi:hypothetical protein